MNIDKYKLIRANINNYRATDRPSPKKQIKNPTDRPAPERRLIKKIVPQQVDPHPKSKSRT